MKNVLWITDLKFGGPWFLSSELEGSNGYQCLQEQLFAQMMGWA